jgi:methylthioribose-1-phosphate isomerase
LIPIEEREQAEVLDITLMGNPVTPQAASARNFAFDITPHRLISGWVTEFGVVKAPFRQNLEVLLKG